VRVRVHGPGTPIAASIHSGTATRLCQACGNTGRPVGSLSLCDPEQWPIPCPDNIVLVLESHDDNNNLPFSPKQVGVG
jgi:hypothetical protein